MKNLRFHEIDLLRLLAALAVLAFHYTYRGTAMNAMGEARFETLAAVGQYGYLGVHLFFVISGLVILVTADGRSARQFIVSRVARLYPAYWCCLTITFLAMVFFGRGLFRVTAGQYLVNLTMLNSFVGVPAVDGAYWSLAVEMKFYLLVLVLMLCGQLRNVKHYLGLWLALTLWFLDHRVPVLSGLLIAPYAGCFIAGATLYLIARDGNSVYKSVLLLGSFFAAQVRAVRATTAAVDGVCSPGDPLVITLVLGAIFLLMYLIAIRATQRFGWERFASFGAITYPLYLLHENLGYLAFSHFGKHVPPQVLLVAVTALMIAAAWCVHHFVEAQYGPRFKTMLCGWKLPTRESWINGAASPGS